MKMQINSHVVTTTILVAIVSTVLAVIELGVIVSLQSGLKPMREAVAKCEQSLPRDQQCRIAYTAEVIKK
jgi:hypothetical protein